MRSVRAEQIVEQPDTPGELRRCEDPPAPQSAETVHLRQAVRDDERVLAVRREFLPNAKCERRVVIEHHLQIRFVHEHTHTAFLRHRADRPQRLCRNQRAAGIVEIRQDDETRVGCDCLGERLDIDREAGLKATCEPRHLCAEIVRDVQQRAVRRLLDEHFIARRKHGGHCQLVRHRGAGRCDDAFLRHAIMLRHPLLKRA
jgi:hypothetical protein